MQARYQNGCLGRITRKDGIERWQFRWRARNPDGSLRPCKKTIGPVSEYPLRSKKLQDILLNLRTTINTQASTRLNSISMAALVEHYQTTELAEPEDEESGKAYSTRKRLGQLLSHWVLPRWGRESLDTITTVGVENWLKTLVKTERKSKTKKQMAPVKPKTRLARASRAKIRNAMSALYNHAIRWQFTDRNPITGPVRGSGVRASAKRMSIPDILTAGEMQQLIAAVELRERVLMFLDMVTGLRRGELAGLKWADIDFLNLQINVTRSVVDQHVGKCKTEISQKPVPMDEYTASDLMAWYQQTPFRAPGDWVFATNSNRAGHKRGKQPLWLCKIMNHRIQPIARKLGITKRIGWHTFRRTYSSMLKANGEDVKVVQELLRHASTKITLDIYAQALTPAKRAAQRKVVGMIRGESQCTASVPRENGVQA
jgi:integrase